MRYQLGDDKITLPDRTIATYTRCTPDALTFEKAAPPKPYAPRNGDRYVVSPKGQEVEVSLERK